MPAAKKGAKVILDSDGAGMVEGVKAKPFLIKPNSEELSHLMGRALDSQQELTAAARELLQTGVQKGHRLDGQPRYAACSAGADHFCARPACSRQGYRWCGDAVIAALAVAEERGLTLEETLRLSTAAGAASVMCTGTQAASLETIQQLMEQVTYREL